MYSCQRKGNTIDPAMAVDTLAPRITNLTIAGVPAANIKIDQVRKLLIVTMPKDYPTYSSGSVAVTMTPGAKVFRLSKVSIDFCNAYFFNGGFSPVTTEDLKYDNRELIITDEKIQKKYRLQIKPEGDMYFGTPSKVYQMRTDGLGDEMKNMAVYNYVDTSGYRGANVVYKDAKTGEEFKREVAGCSNFGDIYISRPVGLPLGKYAVTIQKKSGRQTTNNLFLDVLPGKFSYNGLSHNLSQNQPMKIYGSSLFEGKPVLLEIWHNRTGERFSINTLTFDRTGYGAEVTVPTGLQSGYYYSQLTYDGQSSTMQYAVIKKDDKQPSIGGILEDFSNLDLTRIDRKTITVKREKVYWNWPSPTDHIKAGSSLEVYLQSVSEPAASYSIPIRVPLHWAQSPPWKADDYPSFVIPSSVKAGIYMYRVQYKDKDGSRQISDWLERDVEIQ